jgi:D-aminopeptidase
MLREAAKASVVSATVPELPSAPYECVATFASTNCAFSAALVPGVEQVEDLSVRFAFDTVAETYQCFHVVTAMASIATEPVYG